jgi:apolipoprotein N-acyltransferase
LGLFKEGVLVKDVPLVERGPTVYVRFGYGFPWVAGLLVLLVLFSSLLRPPPLLEDEVQ